MREGTMEDGFAITSRRIGPHIVVVEIVGELELNTVVQAKAYLVEAGATRPDHLVIDLSGVQFLDSSGLALLIAAHSGEDGIHGRLTLLGVTGNSTVERPFARVGLLQMFNVGTDLDALVADLQAGNSSE